MAPQPSHVIRADYTSKDNQSFAIQDTIPSPQSSSSGNSAVEEKTHYLQHLRETVTDMQARINKELTARMDEDKARLESSAVGSGKLVVDDVKEEENYGEEVQEDEDHV